MKKELEKEKVSYESLLAGGLIRFGKLDEADVIGLTDEFYAKYDLVVNKTHIYNPCINFEKGVYSVAGETELERFDNKSKLGEIQGDKVKSFIYSINPEIFVLRKVELLYGVRKSDVQSFNFEEFVAISKVMNEGYLTVTWREYTPYDGNEYIVITQRGRLRLFMLDYCSEIEEFRKLLEDSGYDSNLMHDFLMAQDLRAEFYGVYGILNLDNFINYCETYDRNRYAPKKKDSDKKNKGVGYKKVPKDKK